MNHASQHHAHQSTSLERRSCEGSFYAPTGVQARPQSVDGNTNTFRPLRECPRATLERNKARSSRICGLFLPCCPAAIVFAVWAIVINPLYGESPSKVIDHIGVEIVERGSPSFTNSYSPSSIAVEPACRSMVTTPNHIYPNLIDRASGQAMLDPVTSTTLSRSINKRTRDNSAEFPTITCAVPPNMPRSCSDGIFVHNKEFPETSPSEVFAIVVSSRLGYDCLRHDDSFQSLWSFQPVRPRIGWLYAHSTQSHSPKSTQLFQKRGVS